MSTATLKPPVAETEATPTRAQLLEQLRQHGHDTEAAIADVTAAAQKVGLRLEAANAFARKTASEYRAAAGEVDRVRDERANEKAALVRQIQNLATAALLANIAQLDKDVKAKLGRLRLSSYDRATAQQRQVAQDQSQALMTAQQNLGDVLMSADPLKAVADLRETLDL